jgi:predicted  nucleic acid-binding Zn-ribbon protein
MFSVEDCILGPTQDKKSQLVDQVKTLQKDNEKKEDELTVLRRRVVELEKTVSDKDVTVARYQHNLEILKNRSIRF